MTKYPSVWLALGLFVAACGDSPSTTQSSAQCQLPPLESMSALSLPSPVSPPYRQALVLGFRSLDDAQLYMLNLRDQLLHDKDKANQMGADLDVLNVPTGPFVTVGFGGDVTDGALCGALVGLPEGTPPPESVLRVGPP